MEEEGDEEKEGEEGEEGGVCEGEREERWRGETTHTHQQYSRASLQHITHPLLHSLLGDTLC